MSWTDEKVAKLKELWGKGNTAAQIASIIGGISRNAVIGKAHRLNLSAKIKTRTAISNQSFENSISNKNNQSKKGRRSRFKSLIIEKNFEPENPKQLEELDENICKWPIGHPNEKNFIFVEDLLLKIFRIVSYIYFMHINHEAKKKILIQKRKFLSLLRKKSFQNNNFINF